MALVQLDPKFAQSLTKTNETTENKTEHPLGLKPFPTPNS